MGIYTITLITMQNYEMFCYYNNLLLRNFGLFAMCNNCRIMFIGLVVC